MTTSQIGILVAIGIYLVGMLIIGFLPPERQMMSEIFTWVVEGWDPS